VKEKEWAKRNSIVQNNLVTDNTDNNGIKVGIFGTAGNPVESVLVTGNRVLRGAGIRGVNAGITVTDNAVAAINANTIIDSHNIGIQAINCTAGFTNNVIVHPAKQGFEIPSGSAGSGKFNSNTVVNLNSGQNAFQDDSTSFTSTLAGNNWQSSPPIANGTYKVLARHSGLALDVDHQSTTNGSQLQQWTYNNQGNQHWTLTSIGGNTYTITGVQSGRVLDVPGSSTANGTVLDIWDSNNGVNQMWNITATDSGYNSVVNINSRKAMEVVGGVGATSPGAPVDQWTYGLEFNKQWSFQAP